MGLTELIFDRHTERFMKKGNYVTVEIKPINAPMELQALSKHTIEDMIKLYCPRSADAYCSGFNDGQRAIVQYYKIQAEYKKEYSPGIEEHRANSMHH